MARIIQDFQELIGHTPLVEIKRLPQAPLFKARLVLKLESFNPAGSVKDRTALSMIQEAEEKGLLKPGSVIVEPTSGNTGIGLAALSASRGYRVILTMPDTMSPERQNILRSYGAEIVLTPGKEGMTGAVEKAEALCREIPGSFLPGQFDNPGNPRIHYRTTGPEIWEDTEGAVDIFVAGVGTGGTLTGTGRYLKEKKSHVQIVAVEPARSPLLSEGRSGSHGLQGIGANFIPPVLDRSLVDRIIPVHEKDAYDAARSLSRREGYSVGISGGAALYAAMTLAMSEACRGKLIVALMPDGGDRYYSTPLFTEDQTEAL